MKKYISVFLLLLILISVHYLRSEYAMASDQCTDSCEELKKANVTDIEVFNNLN